MLNLALGASYVVRGINLLGAAGVTRYALIPLTINLLLFSLLTVGGIEWFDAWIRGMIPDYLDYWLVRALAWLVFGLVALLVWFYLFAVLANLVAAPFNAALARAVLSRLRGRPPAAGERGLAAETARTLAAELRKLAYLIGWMLPLGLLFLVPVVNLAAPFLWFAFGAWMLALEYLDYASGNDGLSFVELRAELRRQRSLGLGFGAVMMLLTALPIVNLVTIPIGVAGAAGLWAERIGPAGERRGEEAAA